ncbi:MscL family protein [Weissella diestrammenae]|uniref:MscL family protein n=2 Tax=Weissella diestrammenae TaxID=1162633 RepID=A0A7G9T7P8_9LACO|nr:MscL family protein [Weissella diestrammenae]MCM0582811.1 MscL family protein [Weissella diestrammenae]QNN76123.1 MscL family protein [Weissella diestrammenae]
MINRKKIKSVLPDQLLDSVGAVNTLSDTVMDSQIAGEFRSFLTGDKVTGFAIGVVVGNAFSSFVQNFVELLGGVYTFFKIWIQKNTMDASVIPFGDFSKSFITMLLIAASVFFFIRILNTFLARNPTEKFGYNATLIETKRLHQEQIRTNELLASLIELEKGHQDIHHQ